MCTSTSSKARWLLLAIASLALYGTPALAFDDLDPEWDDEESFEMDDEAIADIDGGIRAPDGDRVDADAFLDDDDEPDWDDPVGDDNYGDDAYGEDPIEDDPESFNAEPELAAPAPRANTGPQAITLSVDGMSPLGNNYPLSIVGWDMDGLVVELPVLLSRSRSEAEGDFWLISQIYVNGAPAGETRQLVSKTGLADLGPTFSWVKAFVPVNREQGTIEVHVSRAGSNGEPSPLFTRSVSYSL
jgi:hypothetical protein